MLSIVIELKFMSIYKVKYYFNVILRNLNHFSVATIVQV